MAPSNGRTRKMKSVALLSRHSAVTLIAFREHGQMFFTRSQSTKHNLEQNIAEANVVQNAQGSMGSKVAPDISRRISVTLTTSREHGPISFMEAQSTEHNLEQNIVETNVVQNAQGSMGSKAAPDIARRTSDITYFITCVLYFHTTGSELMCKTLSLTSCGMDNLSASTPFTQSFSSASGTAVDIGAFITYMTQFASQMNHLATQIGVPLSPGVVPNAEPRHNRSGSSGHGGDEDNRSFSMHTD